MKKKKALIFFDRQYIDAHFCFKEIAVQLARGGYAIDYYFLKAHWAIPSFDPELDIQLFPYSKSKIGTLKLLIQLLWKSMRADCVIVNPQWPLFWIDRLPIPFRTKLICLSDEVYSDKPEEFSVEQQLQGEGWEKWREREKQAHRNCDATIALGEERYQLVKKYNDLPEEHPHFIIPNAPSIDFPQNKSLETYYKDKFGEDDNDVIILHSGGLQWSFLKELKHLDIDNPHVKIVLQTRRKFEDSEKFRARNIFVSDAFFPYKDMVSLSKGADIGLLLYNEENPEERRNGNTAGKLGLYLAAGLPVIGCNLSVFSWLEEEGCGIRITDLSGLSAAISKITENYKEYSMNSRKVFKEKFDYKKNFATFKAWLDSN